MENVACVYGPTLQRKHLAHSRKLGIIASLDVCALALCVQTHHVS